MMLTVAASEAVEECARLCYFHSERPSLTYALRNLVWNMAREFSIEQEAAAQMIYNALSYGIPERALRPFFNVGAAE